MIRTIIFIIVLFSAACNNGTDESSESDSSKMDQPSISPSADDSLSKYSYCIKNHLKKVIGKDQKVTAGTGFFWRRGNILYFITAKHVVNGREHNGDLTPSFPDTMWIALGGKSDIPVATRNFRDSILPAKLSQGRDFVVIKVNKADINVNSCERFPTSTQLGFTTGYRALVFGFPEVGAVPPDPDAFEMQEVKGISNSFTSPSYIPASEKQQYSYPYFGLNNDPFRPITEGFSGAPVFIISSDNKVFFSGIINGGWEVQERAFALKPKILLERITALSN